MNGSRVHGKEPHQFAVGDYGIWDGQGWYARCPDGSVANLTGHDVTEHPDGTISVSPSIRTSNGRGELWHGYLMCGVWKECE